MFNNNLIVVKLLVSKDYVLLIKKFLLKVLLIFLGNVM